MIKISSSSAVRAFMLFTVVIGISCQTQVMPQKARVVEDGEKVYLVQDSILIRMRDGAKISAIVVRNSHVDTPQAAILFHTIYARHTDIEKAKRAANLGYAGVISYTRGKGLSPEEIIPYEYEANDVHEIIDWISHRSWSNGKVGMYGGSYVGFVQWAATKKLHPALKTIVPSVAAAPGIAEPMENGVFQNFLYPWPHYVATNKYLNNDLYNDNQRWNELYQKMYDEGTPYRSLDSLDGLPNKIFRKWLDHPTYDSYWQDMMPYKEEFSKIDIPVLTTTGYYDGGQIGAMHYLREHYKYNNSAEHYLVIGPYTHFGAQTIPDTSVGNYAIDPVAQINISALIFEWFDYIFKDAPKPSLLKNRINYQIMGSNTWGHVPTISSISNDTLTYYFDNGLSGVKCNSTFGSGNDGHDQHFSLAKVKSESLDFLQQEVDFTDRSPAAQNNYFTPFVINETLTVGNGYSFITAPFEEDFELNGSFFGNLKIVVNKKDFDYSMVLYEQTPKDEYFMLTLRHIGRASHAIDVEKRQLLVPHEMATIPFTNVRMTSKKINKGSRLILVLNVNKHAYEQLNYGSGKDVSDESVSDSKEPLMVKWYNDSYIGIPIKK